MVSMSHLPQATLPQMQKVQLKIVALSVFIPNSSRQPLKVHLRKKNVIKKVSRTRVKVVKFI